jgi:hypothetical protein
MSERRALVAAPHVSISAVHHAMSTTLAAGSRQVLGGDRRNEVDSTDHAAPWTHRHEQSIVRRQVWLPGGRRHVFIRFPLDEGVTFHPRTDKDTWESWTIAADVVRHDTSGSLDVRFYLRRADLPPFEGGIEEIRCGADGWRSEMQWLDLSAVQHARVACHDERRLRAHKLKVHVLECDLCDDVSEPNARGWVVHCTDAGATTTCPRCLSIIGDILIARSSRR